MISEILNVVAVFAFVIVLAIAEVVLIEFIPRK